MLPASCYLTVLDANVVRTLCILSLSAVSIYSLSDENTSSFLLIYELVFAEVSYSDPGARITTDMHSEISSGTFLASNKSMINESNSNSKTNFTLYSNPLYGLTIKYPSLWTVTNSNQADPFYRSFTSEGDGTFYVVAKFSSPVKDGNVSLGTGRIINGDAGNSSRGNLIDQFINNTIDNRRQAFTSFDLIDVEVGHDLAQNRTYSNGGLLENTSLQSQALYNLTYSAQETKNNMLGSFPIRAMEVGSIINNTVYTISFVSDIEKYQTYLPTVIEMISSLEIGSASANSQNVSLGAAREKGIGEVNSSALSSEDLTRQGSGGQGLMMTNHSSINPPVFPLTAGTLPANPSTAMPYNNPSYPTGTTTPPYNYPPIPYNYPPIPYNYPPIPYNYPPIPYNYPPIPYNYPPIPYNYPPPFWQANQFYYPTIVNYNTYNDTTGTFHIVGEVQNTTPATINSVQVIASFYDNLNQLVATKFAYTNPSSISAGQRAIFDLTLPPKTIPTERVSQWTLNLIWQ